jgi:serine/threonine protein kinase/tetratricopeptide (TPR) repeat protein
MKSDDDKTQSHIALTTGTMVAHYRIVEKIGAGGMGEVYLAEDTKLNRNVALKFLRSYLCQDEGCRARFKREAQAAAGINHPNTVTIHEIDEYGGRPFFSMEHVTGASLKAHAADKELSIDRVLELSLQICEGLNVAHERGVIHRDMKPSNIILDSNGRAKIVDFGLASVAGSERITRTGSTMGTVGYMSPEQAEGKVTDHRSDLFSLGIIMYQMITGRHPFRGNDEASTLHSVIYDHPEPLTRFRPGVPDNLQRIVFKLLEKDLSHRYQSAAALLSDLMRIKVKDPGLSMDLPDTVRKRLAVLYLQNRGAPDDEYLCYGITEDLIVDLTRNSSIGVAPMRSVIKYKDSDADLADIAKALKVDLVVDGSILKRDEVISVSVQLVDTSAGENLWAERWNEIPDNLPHIKESLARGISDALSLGPKEAQTAELGHPDAQNPKAYDFYLRGKYAFQRKTNASDVVTARGLLEKALELEPTFLAARISLAEILDYQGKPKESREELAKALAEAEARQMKTEEGRALLLLAAVSRSSLRYTEAHEYTNKALSLSVNQGDLDGELNALLTSIRLFTEQGRFTEAIDLFDRVMEICRTQNDRLALSSTLLQMGHTYRTMNDLEQAVPLLEKSMEIAKELNDLHNIGMIHREIAQVNILEGKMEAATRQSQMALEIHRELENPREIDNDLRSIGARYVSSGEYSKYRDLVLQRMAILKELGADREYTNCQNCLAAVYMNLGEYDEALQIYDSIHETMNSIDDPRFHGVIHQNTGFNYFYKGEPTTAELHYLESHHTNEQLGSTQAIAFSAASLCELYFFMGDLDSSRKYGEMVMAIAREITIHNERIWASNYLAAIQVREGDFDEGVKRLRLLVEESNQLSPGESHIRSKRILGQSLFEFGRSDEERREGLKQLKEALALAAEKQLAHEVGWINEILKAKE